jgi:hypothetical protein
VSATVAPHLLQLFDEGFAEMNDDSSAATAPDTNARVKTSKADRDRSLGAIHLLELYAESAAPGRQQEWLAGIRVALESLRDALNEQAENSLAGDSLLSAMEQDEPRLGPKIDHLRRRYRAIGDQVDTLDRELRSAAEPDAIDFTDIRQALDLLTTELRYQRVRENDLVYEAYSLDLGEGD